MKVLVVEDDPSLREIICTSLRKERFIVEEAPHFDSALDKALIYNYDCILLDIMLPGGNGLDLLKILNKHNKREHVIIISAKDSIDDKVLGLDLGADDYLAKPFHLNELIARVRSVIRRGSNNDSSILEYGNVRVDINKFQVLVDNRSVELNRKEYDILLYFIQRPEKVVNKMYLAESVWGDNIDQVDNFDFIYAQVKNLRKKLVDAGSTIEIKAVYGFGYKMVLKA